MTNSMQIVFGRVSYGITIRIGKFPVQTSLGTQLVLGTQPHYKAPIDLWVENIKNVGISIE